MGIHSEEYKHMTKLIKENKDLAQMLCVTLWTEWVERVELHRWMCDNQPDWALQMQTIVEDARRLR